MNTFWIIFKEPQIIWCEWELSTLTCPNVRLRMQLPRFYALEMNTLTWKNHVLFMWNEKNDMALWVTPVLFRKTADTNGKGLHIVMENIKMIHQIHRSWIVAGVNPQANRVNLQPALSSQYPKERYWWLLWMGSKRSGLQCNAAF